MWNFPLMPEQASEHAVQHDLLFFAITALTVLFSAIVGFLILFLAIRYRVGAKVDRSNPPHENLKLELAWSVLPLMLALGIFFWSAHQFADLRTPPKDARDIFVVGKQWMWHIQHSSGIRENNELHVPVGVPLRVTMISQDVIHAFFLPAFRVQMHAVPGRYTQMWFKATKPGKYPLFCTMHCGTQHSEMGGYVYVLTKEEFNAWEANGGNRFKPVPETLVDAGKRLFEENVCGNCHGQKDTERGPSLYALYGRSRRFTNRSETIADEAYIRESILDPYKRINLGYDQTMPAYKDSFTEEQVLQLIAYIKSLGTLLITPPANPAKLAVRMKTQGEAR